MLFTFLQIQSEEGRSVSGVHLIGWSVLNSVRPRPHGEINGCPGEARLIVTIRLKGSPGSPGSKGLQNTRPTLDLRTTGS